MYPHWQYNLQPHSPKQYKKKRSFIRQFSNIFSCDTVLFFHTILCQNSFFHQCYKFNLDLTLSSHLNIHYSFFVNKDLELNKRTVDGCYLTADSPHSVNERREVVPRAGNRKGPRSFVFVSPGFEEKERLQVASKCAKSSHFNSF